LDDKKTEPTPDGYNRFKTSGSHPYKQAKQEKDIVMIPHNIGHKSSGETDNNKQGFLLFRKESKDSAQYQNK
jgi:cupin superfamily acireductone dioxygenase involved in methionine salvage